MSALSASALPPRRQRCRCVLVCLLLSWLVVLAGPLLRASTVSAMAAAVCSARTPPALLKSLASAPANPADAATPDAPGEPTHHGSLDCALCLVQVLAAPPPAFAGLLPVTPSRPSPSGLPPSPLLISLRGLPMARAPPSVL